MPTDSTPFAEILDEEKIFDLLKNSTAPNDTEVDQILEKAKKLKGLRPEDAAQLLQIKDSKQLQKLYATALQVKEAIYGNRLVFFAPLYVSNYCTNNCLYCGFRRDNTKLERVCLEPEELKQEVLALLRQGHKRVLMLMGEHPTKCSFDYFLEAIKTVYSVKDEKGNSIRRINVEIAPLKPEEFEKLGKAEIGTYAVFQESYHKQTYEKMHPGGKKSDFNWRLNVMDRALTSGMHDVGIGVLFGLYDYKFEVLALLMHAEHLDTSYSVGPHTISVPRIEPAEGAPISTNIPYPVADEDFKKLIAILRCAVPYTGIILSTRESAELRKEVFKIGISQISAGSKTDPGGYHEDTGVVKKLPNAKRAHGQFAVSDNRTTREVLSDVIKDGFAPSFCTACYRSGRVGKDFMEMAKPGLIQQNCLPNSLLTLKEFLLDYADEETKITGEAMIKQELEKIPNAKRKEQTIAFLKRMEAGERDLFC